MPLASVQRIVGELAWVGQTPDPSKCGCRDVRCGAEHDETFSAFERATEKFAASIKKLHQDVEANRYSKT